MDRDAPKCVCGGRGWGWGGEWGGRCVRNTSPLPIKTL